MDVKGKSAEKSAREKKNHFILNPIINLGDSLHWVRSLVRIWGGKLESRIRKQFETTILSPVSTINNRALWWV